MLYNGEHNDSIERRIFNRPRKDIQIMQYIRMHSRVYINS